MALPGSPDTLSAKSAGDVKTQPDKRRGAALEVFNEYLDGLSSRATPTLD